MPRLIDITGRRYGELTVIERSEVRIKGRKSWLCVCDCGATCNADALAVLDFAAFTLKNAIDVPWDCRPAGGPQLRMAVG